MVRLADGTPVYWSFQVQTSCDGKKILKVVAFDRASGQVMGEGYGVSISGDTMVRAAIGTSASGYEVYIRNYKQTTAKGTRQVTVLTLRPVGGDGTTDVHLIAQKKSSLFLEEYLEKLREQRTSRPVH